MQYRIPDKEHIYLVPAIGWLFICDAVTLFTDFSTTAPVPLVSPKISTWPSYYCTFNITGVLYACSTAVPGIS